jgi:serine/threonine-protein kinase
MPKRYGQVGPWTDVFGLALTMVEVLTGKPPIEGDIAAMMGTTNDPTRRPTPRNEGAHVSDEVEAVFTRALAVDPRERTQSIEAFWTALEAAVGTSPSIHETSAIVSLSMPSETPPSLPAGAARPPDARVSPVARTVEAPRTASGLHSAVRSASGPHSTPRVSPAPDSGPRVSPVPTHTPRLAPAIPPRSPDVRPPQDDVELDAAPPTPAGPAVPFELAVAPRARQREEGTLAAEEAAPSRDFGHLREQMSVPLKLLLVGLTVSAGDWLYTSRTGELLAVGNVRPVWIAGPLVLIGLGLACWRLIANL